MLANPFNWRVRWPRPARPRVPLFSLGLGTQVHVATAGGWLTPYRPREVRNSIYRYRKIHIDYRSEFLYRFISPISIIYGNTNRYMSGNIKVFDMINIPLFSVCLWTRTWWLHCTYWGASNLCVHIIRTYIKVMPPPILEATYAKTASSDSMSTATHRGGICGVWGGNGR